MQASIQLLANYGFNADRLDLADGSYLNHLQLVRHIPHRRLVCRGTWQEKTVYIKLFLGKKAEHYAARDATGIDALQNAGLLTPALLYKGVLKDGQTHLLVLSEILDAPNVEEAWQHLTEKSRLTLAKKLIQAVARHHNAGLIQTDLYLKNFLIQGEKIYTLDGDGIRQFTALPKSRALDNLSVLLSKFDVLELENWLPELLKIYAQTRDWKEYPDLVVIKNKANKHRRIVASSYAGKKVFRTCTDVKVTTLKRLFYAVSSAYKDIGLSADVAQLDDYLTPQSIIKNGKTCTVATALIDDKKIVIKRYNIKGFWHGVNRALRKTRAAISWTNSHRLRLLGIKAVDPVALIESRNWGLKGKAYFLAEYVDAPNVAEFFKLTSNKGHRAAAIKNIATLFYRLHLLQISHGDMKATNIKMEDNKPVLIDLDSMKQHRYAWRALQTHVGDLQRFMQNWKAEPALYNAFVKTFRAVYKDQSPLEMAKFQDIKS